MFSMRLLFHHLFTQICHSRFDDCDSIFEVDFKGSTLADVLTL